MRKQKDIPEEILEIMNYLAGVFSHSMHNSVQSKEDLMQDLAVVYFENLKQPTKIKKPADKNRWFILFKSTLLNKYKRVVMEKAILSDISKELVIRNNLGIKK